MREQETGSTTIELLERDEQLSRVAGVIGVVGTGAAVFAAGLWEKSGFPIMGVRPEMISGGLKVVSAIVAGIDIKVVRQGIRAGRQLDQIRSTEAAGYY